MYSPTVGRWNGVDALAEGYQGHSPYGYVRNSPIFRKDVGGLWDITVHVYNDREQYGYGVAVVTDNDGNEIYRFQVRAEGTGGRDRMEQNADTPLGTYDIPDDDFWLSGGSRESYGPNKRLVLNGISGEIFLSGRSLIRVHGERQEVFNPETGEWEPVSNPELKKTHGCLRCYDGDILELEGIISDLMGSDPSEKGGTLTVIDDLVQEGGEYYVPGEQPSSQKKTQSQASRGTTYRKPGNNASEAEKGAWDRLTNALADMLNDMTGAIMQMQGGN